jgi:hypothetical protein
MAWLYRPQCFDNDNELRQSYLKTADARHWAESTRGSIKWVANYKNERGAGSLQDMAWRSVMVNMSWLDAETLARVPWHIGERLWRKVQAKLVKQSYYFKLHAVC